VEVKGVTALNTLTQKYGTAPYRFGAMPILASIISMERMRRLALACLTVVCIGPTITANAQGVTRTHSFKVRPPQPSPSPGIITGPLNYRGGPVQSAPKVYVVFWGWTSDPSGEQPYLINFLSSVGGTDWLNTVTQYGGGNPTDLYGGSWSDPTPIPTQPTPAQMSAEAFAAMAHFGLASSVNVQIVVATPTGHSSSGFVTTFCSVHVFATQGSNYVIYTNFPYMTDAGGSCGAGFVSAPLDGVSIVEGHELAESITDPEMNAWVDAGGSEIGDKCAWTNVTDITTGTGTFPVQPLWSNSANGCVLATPVPAPSVDGPTPLWAIIAFAAALIGVSYRAQMREVDIKQVSSR
jgi:hypothetical protein